MTCQELVELVTEQRARFDQHLKACPYCVTYMDQMRTTIGALGRLTEQQLTDQARTELLAAFRDWKRPG
jgi:anti-sigma factor RsiW